MKVIGGQSICSPMGHSAPDRRKLGGMKLDPSITLFHYWNRLRGERAAPTRAEVEPADIKTMLADTFILERDTRGEAVFRLAGTRLCATYGREMKGFAFPSLWQAKDQRLVAKLAHGVFQSKSVVVIEFEGTSAAGRRNFFELLLLPLDGGVENPRALGVLSAGEKVFWLGADPIVEGTIDSVHVVDPNREPMFLKNRPSVKVPPLAPDGLPVSARRIRHLLVLDGGREP